MKEGRIIDGWHRNYTGSTDPVLSERMYHYLPRVCIEGDEADQREATLLFNETKGKHYVEKEGQVIREPGRTWTGRRRTIKEPWGNHLKNL